MAVKSTIYRYELVVSNFDRDDYRTLTQTLAKHPSESIERMLVRILCFALNASDTLAYGRGISHVDEPDLWQRDADVIELWIDVGEPSYERVKKASRSAKATRIYSFNSKSDTWWKLFSEQGELAKVSVFQLSWAQIQALAAVLPRGGELSISISDGHLHVGVANEVFDVNCRSLTN